MGPMSLPPGFRFHPTDDELVGYYLKRKVDGKPIELEVIPVIDLYKFDPWELPDKSFLPKRDMEWFFFCPRDKKYPNGSRTNRATSSGYWKATGKDRKVFCESSVQGLRKTLVFYRGRAPGGERTDWVMHEYRLCEDLSQPTPNFMGAFALCRVVKRTEQGLKLGDSMVEAKGKRSFSSTTNDFSPRKNSSKSSDRAEEPSSQAASLFEICSDSPLITSSVNGRETELHPVVFGTDQTGFWGSQYLSNAPMEYPLGQSLLTEPVHSTQFANLVESCPTNSLSSVSSYASFTEDTFLVDEFNHNGSSSSFPSNFYGMNAYCDEQNMGLPELGWEMSYINTPFNGIEAYNTTLSPLVCRQASDIDEANLWLQEDSLVFAM
ncbi:uncharacterized protein A4U43_C04F17040 [Asparagus officinalis]|uniref:NAC domain-containing protein n=1 Tax=Asparagus officinalis TaxID=4686 RepID=A0A5P1F1I3_ASPOF|nr:NAC domain-containing protein 86-like [Asparagus officinalis]ONK72215.1 uncharacterized protein A4U43_C04F17040 [Asparagus officinalis]